jgi:16S rRNA (cytosine1402-N4)-methyltransferase
MSIAFEHKSVLLEESIEALAIKSDGLYVDATMGGGGHSFEIVRRLTTGRLIGIDQDKDAIGAATERLKPYLDKVTIVCDNFCNISQILEKLHIEKIDGILMDLGVSSYQLDEAERGFSYHADAPLDMRMAKGQGLSAYEVVNTYSKEHLTKILKEYGEEKFAGRIAQRICLRRETSPIVTTQELVDVIKEGIPAAARREGGHPAKRSFQAIRIEVNQELEVLKKGMEDALEALAPDGRMAIITFHSLEDRIVKSTFAEWAKGCICPKDFPVCVCNHRPRVKLVSKKPIVPTQAEEAQNNRSRSAKLRVAQKM